MGTQKKKWSELSSRQQTAILVLGSIEVALTATALADLMRRPSDQVRGDKRLWALGVFVQPFGPIAYLAWGARGGRALEPVAEPA
jgi:hypothetical protein